jgi:curli biogenesis system outer membrane secretion channel CsgG
LTKRLLIGIVVICLLPTLGCVVNRTQLEKLQRADQIEFEVMKELGMFRGKIKKQLRITCGAFYDKTGQHKDLDRTRYSKAVTQGAEEILYHMLYKALGPRRVLERQNQPFVQLLDEYKLSYVGTEKKGRHTGLIKHGGPKTFLVGANYMVTGAVVYYNEDRYSGGGGVNVDGLGGHFRKTYSRVGIEMRLVDMNTSEIVWSTMVESWVSATEVGVDMFRFVTILGEEYLVSAEAGAAQYLPTDFALQICMASAVVDMIKENKEIFITEDGAPQEQPAKGKTDQKKKAQKPAPREEQGKRLPWLKPPGAVKGW